MVQEPELTDALRARLANEAAQNPGGWVYQIDGDYGPADGVPPHVIIGAWEVDNSGQLTGVFKENPNYRAKT